MSYVIQIDSPPAEVETLKIVAGDDFGNWGGQVAIAYASEATKNQLSTFFVAYREADKHYYIVKKGGGSERSKMLGTAGIAYTGDIYEGIYNRSLTDPFAVGDTVTCKKFNDPGAHASLDDAVTEARQIIQHYAANYDPVPESPGGDNLTSKIIFSYEVVNERGYLFEAGGEGEQGFQGYQGDQGAGYQGYSGGGGYQGYQGYSGGGYQGYQGPAVCVKVYDAHELNCYSGLIYIDDGGSNYTSDPSIVYTSPAIDGHCATPIPYVVPASHVYIRRDGGAIAEAEVIDWTCRWSVQPTISFSGGTGAGGENAVGSWAFGVADKKPTGTQICFTSGGKKMIEEAGSDVCVFNADGDNKIDTSDFEDCGGECYFINSGKSALVQRL